MLPSTPRRQTASDLLALFQASPSSTSSLPKGGTADMKTDSTEITGVLQYHDHLTLPSPQRDTSMTVPENISRAVSPLRSPSLITERQIIDLKPFLLPMSPHEATQLSQPQDPFTPTTPRYGTELSSSRHLLTPGFAQVQLKMLDAEHDVMPITPQLGSRVLTSQHLLTPTSPQWERQTFHLDDVFFRIGSPHNAQTTTIGDSGNRHHSHTNRVPDSEHDVIIDLERLNSERAELIINTQPQRSHLLDEINLSRHPTNPSQDSSTVGTPALRRSRRQLERSSRAHAYQSSGERPPEKVPSKSSSKELFQTKPLAERASLLQEGRADQFLVANQHLFLPLLPPRNYISRLQITNVDDKTVEGTKMLPSTITPLSPRSTQSTKLIQPLTPGQAVQYEEVLTQPKGVVATMKPYQLKGLSFLIWLARNGVGGILGDEMGLGKTLQTLSLLQLLKELNTSSTQQPHLIVCPLSVLNTWVSESAKFTPSLRFLTFHGPPTMRNVAKANLLASNKRVNALQRYDCVVTNYETVQSEQAWFTRMRWSYVILDEGHRIKNYSTKLSKACQKLKGVNRLLLTGTPLQNDLMELWSLLHWLFPKVFTEDTSLLTKDAFYLTAGKVNTSVMENCAALLQRIMLRRTQLSPGVDLQLAPKKAIMLYVPLSFLQRLWTKRLITRSGDGMVQELFGEADTHENPPSPHGSETNIGTVQGYPSVAAESKTAWKKLSNLLVQLRQVCVHPYLIPDARPPEPYKLGNHVIEASSKFVILAKLIDDLVVKENRKILIFSGFKGVLDCCEDLLVLKGSNSRFHHLRFDGDTSRARRNLHIRLFQDDRLDYQVMLISIKAGGLGLNLPAASYVIFLDEDWNPQNTLQAEARAHRIGQKNEVTILKICTQGTVEEAMLGRLRKKLYLSARVLACPTGDVNQEEAVQQDITSTPRNGDMPRFNLSEVKSIIRGTAKSLLEEQLDLSKILEWDLETVLQRCEGKSADPEEGREKQFSNFESEELQWLSSPERIRCALFEGVELQREAEASDKVPHELSRSDRRRGKETTVMIDGFAVSKRSMQCGEWEAVPTLAGKEPRVAEPKRAKNPPFKHQEHCQICKDGGQLFCCTGCPRSYHASCLEQPIVEKIRPWFCPQHSCAECHKKTSGNGGLLLHCKDCERAFCEDCLQWGEAEWIGESLQDLEQLGYPATDTASYILCPRHTAADGHEGLVASATTIPAPAKKEDRWTGDRLFVRSPLTMPDQSRTREPSLDEFPSSGSSASEPRTPVAAIPVSLKRKFAEWKLEDEMFSVQGKDPQASKISRLE